jgi:hypothetical protein
VKIRAKHLKSLLPRHIIPALFVLWLFSILIAIRFFAKPLIVIWLAPAIPYFVGVISATRQALNEKVEWYLVVPTFPVIHIACGIGFLTGLFRWWKSFLTWIKRDR